MRKVLLGLGGFVLAFAILAISIFRSASVTYILSAPVPTNPPELRVPSISFALPYPGRVLPDSPLWTLKAARDKVWYALTSNPLKRAELALLFSDKRLLASKTLFEEKKSDIALTTLTKGEKYLEVAMTQEELASSEGFDTSEFLANLANTALKHREIIEVMMSTVPEDGQPEVVKAEDYAKNAYKFSRDRLSDKGLTAPINPFDGD